MQKDYDREARELLESGRLDSVITSPDGAKVSKMMENQRIQNAVKEGDPQAIQNAVKDILKTPEGARLARQISEMFRS